jgi:hypothetical protein
MKGKHWTDYVIPLTAIVAVILSGWQTLELRKQNALENRPFVSIEDVRWWYRPQNWFGSSFKRVNYGEKPAEEFRFQNFRAIVLQIDEEEIRQRVTANTPPELSRYLELYVVDERNQVILQLMEVLADYFRTHPDASHTEVMDFLHVLSSKPQLLTGKDLLAYNGKLLLTLLEVNGDMDPYRKQQRSVVYPGQPVNEGLGLQMGSPYLQNVIEGSNVLVVYWAFAYQDIRRAKEYSSCYLGYAASGLTELLARKHDRDWFSLQQFQSWSSEKSLRRVFGLL